MAEGVCPMSSRNGRGGGPAPGDATEKMTKVALLWLMRTPDGGEGL